MDFRHLLEQAQNFQRHLSQIDKDLVDARATGSSGGGAARATVNGLGEVLEVEVAPELLASGDARLVAQTMVAALRQAQESAKREREERRARVLGDLELPDL